MATVDPANGAGSIAIGANIAVTFSEAVQPSTVTATTFTVTPQGGSPVAANVSAAGSTATLTPANPLEYGTAYTVNLTTGVLDLAGNALIAFQSTFTSAPQAIQPTVNAVSPANGSAGVPASTTVTVTFNAPVTSSSVTTATFTLTPTAGGSPVAASVAYDGNLTAVLTPAAPLAPNTAYTVNLTSGIVNAAGLTLVPHQSGFSTAAAADLTPPHVTAIVPGNAATGVPVASTIQVTFSEAVSIGPLDATSFQVRGGGPPLPGTVAYNALTKTATFTPAASFAYLTTYTVSLGTGIQDLAGNTLTTFTSSFTTTAVPDLTPPAVIGKSPADGATGIALDAQIAALFSEPVNAQTVTTATFLLNNGTVPGTVSYDALSRTALFTPAAGLANDTTYTATLGGDIQDLAGNRLGSNVSWQFTTTPAPDVLAPTVVSTTPANGATDVSAGLATVTATFSEALSAGTVNAETFQLSGGSAPVGGTVTYDAANQKATLALAGALANSTVYTATLTSGITDLSGNPLSAASWSFTTASAVVTPPGQPTVNGVSPANGTSGVPVFTTVSVTFSAPVTSASVTTATFTLAPSGGGPVPASVAYDGNLTAVLTPASPLAPDTAYTVNLTSGIVSSAGLTLVPHQSGFRTAAAADLTPPRVTAIVPGNAATGVPVDSTIQVTFSEDVSISPFEANGFQLSDGVSQVPGSVAYNALAKTATFTSAASLSYLTTYTVSLGTGIQDLSGNTLTTFTSSFTTTAVPDVTPPAVIGTSPANGASGIALDAQITALFSEPLNAQTVTTATFLVNSGNVAGTVSYNALTKTALFTPAAALANGVTYTATLGAAIQDLAGNPLGSNVSWQFTTTPAPDVTPPTVLVTTPANLATDVSAGLATVTATFSEALSAGTVNAATFQLSGGSGSVGGTVTYDAGNLKAIFTPAGALAPSTVYTATLTSGITDLTGNPLAAVFWSFTTAAAPDVLPPTVLSMVPADGATGISAGLATVTATFSEALRAGNVNADTFQLSDGSAPVGGAVTYDDANQKAIFTIAGSLAPSTVYTATLTSGITDLAGNPLSAAFWSFTTAAPADVLAPTVVSTIPANGAPDVSAGLATVTAGFSEALSAGTVNAATFQLSNGSGPVGGTATYDAANQKAIFTIASSLAPSTVYTATLTSGITDLAGNPLSAAFWTFTTAAPADVLAPTVVSTTPANGATDVSTGLATVTATFSEALSAGTVNAATFQLSAGSTPVGGTVTYDAANQKATFAPAALSASTVYTATLTSGITDLGGNPLSAASWSFTTAAPVVIPPPAIQPTVNSVSPANGSAGVPVFTTVTVTFSAPVTPASVTTATFTLAPTAGGSPVAASVAYDGNLTAVLTPAAPLAADTAYTVNLTSGIVNSAGLTLVPHQSGFSTAAAADLTPPHVTAIVPGNADTGVPVGSTIQVTFNEAVSISPLDANTFQVSDGGSPFPGTVAYNALTKTATFTPAASLSYLTTYTVSLGTGIQDLSGNTLTTFTSSFTTTALPDSTPPSVISTSPAAGTSGIALDAPITALFSEPVNAQTVTTATFLVNAGNVAGTVGYNALTNTATFTPTAGLANGVTYTATLSGTIQDLAGNPLGSNVSWQFTTTPAPDVTPPTVLVTTPADGVTGISAGLAIVTATFSEALSADTVTAATFQLSGGSGSVGGTVTYDAANQKATLALAGALATTTVYTATLTSGITDLAGNPLAATVWSFTTAAASEVLVPGVTQTVQPDGSTVVGVDLNNLDSTQIADAISTLQGLLDGSLTTAGPLNVTMTGDPNNPLALSVPLIISRSDVNIVVSPSGTITLDGSNVIDPATGQLISNIVEVSGSNVTLDGINVVSGQVDLITQPGGATSGVVLRNLVLHDAVTDDCINLRDCTDCLIENVQAYRCFKKGLQLTGVTNITVRNVIIGVGDENAGPITCNADDTTNTTCMFGSNSPRAFVEIFKSNGGLIDGLTIYASRSGAAGTGSSAPDGSNTFGNGILMLQNTGNFTLRNVTIHDSALAPVAYGPHGMISVWDHATASTITIENANIHHNASKAFSFSKKSGVNAVIDVTGTTAVNNAGGLIEVLNGPIGCSFTGSILDGDPSAFCTVTP